MKNNVLPKLGSKKTSRILLLFLLAIFAILVFASLPLTKSGDNRILPREVFENQNFGLFERYAHEKGVQNAYAVLKNIYAKNEPAAHDFAHIVGIIAFEKNGLAGLSICDTAYNYGCYHGFIESFITKSGVEKVSHIEGNCVKLGPVHAPSCLHGIGHGLLINTSYNLEAALFDCDRLNVSSRTYCWDGVFMERITGSMLSANNRPVLGINSLKEPCQTLNPDYKKQCFRNQVTLWFNYFSGNTTEIAKQCLDIKKEYQEICFESMGNIIAMKVSENQAAIINHCQVFPNGLISDFCLFGVMDELMFEGRSPQITQSLCSFTSRQEQSNCQNRFQRLFSEYQSRFKK